MRDPLQLPMSAFKARSVPFVLSIVLALAASPLWAQPDLTATKTNDLVGSGTVGTAFNWSITVANGGDQPADFSSGGFILVDALPDVGMTYGTPSIVTQSGVVFSDPSGNINCTLASSALTCLAQFGTTTIQPAGFFTVQFSATPSSAGTFANPRPGGGCLVDLLNAVSESDESNNTCSDSVLVTTGASGPDLTIAKNNNVGGSVLLGQSWTWSLQVSNGGTEAATFDSGETLLRDNLPDSNISYGTAIVSGETGISGTGSIACSVVASDLICTASGGTVILAAETGGFAVSVLATPSATGIFSNPRGGGSCGVDPDGEITEGNESNNACSDAVTVDPSPDLTAVKTNDLTGTGTVGTPFNWSITVTNAGPVPATFGFASFVLIDSLPDAGMTYGTPAIVSQSGVTGSAVDCSIASSTLTCSPLSGDTVFATGGFITVEVAVTPTVAASFDNPRSGGICTADPTNAVIESSESNNACSDTVVITTGVVGPDLTIAKSNDAGGSVLLGDDWTWSLQVSNGGTGAATFNSGETIVSDGLPNADIVYGAATVGSLTGISGTGSIACAVMASNLTCTASGGTVILAASNGGFQVSLPATPSAVGSFANPRAGASCGVDPGGLITEGDETNNACSDAVTVDPSPDLTAVKSNDTSGTASVGVPFTWSITVTNEGGAPAVFGPASILLVDALPDADMTYASPTIVNQSGVTFSPAGASIDCSIASAVLVCQPQGGSTQIAVNGFFTVEFSATPTAPGTFDNPRSGASCTTDATNAIFESDESNNACSDSVSVPVPLPDLTVVKSNDVGGATEVVDSWTWSLAVANGGAGAATFTSGQTLLSDELPDTGLAYGAPTVDSQVGISGTGTITCSIASSNLTCTAVGGPVMLADGSGAFAVRFAANSSAVGTFSNPRAGGACAVDPAAVLDEEDEGNNACSDSVDVAASPDLTATKDNDTSGSGGVGVPFRWSVVVANGGAPASFPSGSRILLDNLPNGDIVYGPAAVTASSGVSGSGAIDCSIAAADLTCTAVGGEVDLAVGGSFTVAFDATPTAVGTFVNPRAADVCAVDPDGVEAETDEGNNACGDTVVAQGPDLTVTKSNDAGGMGSVGQPFDWAVAVANGGPGIATFAAGEVLLQDDLPGGATYGAFSVDGVVDVSGSGSLNCAVAADVLSCTATGGSLVLGPGGGFTVTGAATPTVEGALDNPPAGGVCAVDPADRIAEVDEGNNTCSDRMIIDAPDLRLSKSADVGPVLIGERIVYTLDYSNMGSASASGVVLTESVPSLTTFVPADSTAGWVCLPDGSAGSLCDLDLGALASGAGGSATFVVEVVGGEIGDVIANTASIADDGTNGDDVDPANNTDGVVIGLVTDIPTLGTWGLLLTFLLLAACGVRAMRRRGLNAERSTSEDVEERLLESRRLRW